MDNVFKYTVFIFESTPKPKIEDYGSCKCQTCENVELLLSSLKRNNMVSRDHDLDFFINNSRNGDNELENESFQDLENLKQGIGKS